jgi:hypothetical protein
MASRAKVINRRQWARGMHIAHMKADASDRALIGQWWMCFVDPEKTFRSPTDAHR